MKKQALLIGLNEYQVLKKLKYARGDAEEFSHHLQRYCGFSEQDITLMSCRAEGGLRGSYHLLNLTLF